MTANPLEGPPASTVAPAPRQPDARPAVTGRVTRLPRFVGKA